MLDQDHPARRALEQLGERLRAARVRRKLRQVDLAARIGCTRQRVATMERGSPATEIGMYAEALWAMGLLEQLDLVADPGLDRDAQALTFSVVDKRVRPRQRLDNEF